MPGRRVLPTSPFKAPAVEQVVYAVGDWVTSDRHGLGRVISVEAAHDDVPARVLVDYRGGNVRWLTSPGTTLTGLAD